MKTPTAEFTLGIDLAQESFDAALAADGTLPTAWRTLPHAHFEAAPQSPEGIEALLAWLRTQAPPRRVARVVVESTGGLSQRFARALRRRQLPEVAIVNPRQIKHLGIGLGVRDKTDRIDAAVIAIYGMLKQVTPPAPPNAVRLELRELTRVRTALMKDKVAWQNRARQFVGAAARRDSRAAVAGDEKMIGLLETQIEAVTVKDEPLARQVRWLKQIPGIGPRTAILMTAELGPLEAWGRNQLAARAGVYPKLDRSGKRPGRSRMAKGAGASIRATLYMCAMSLLRSKGKLRRYADQLIAQGKHPRFVIGILMHKLLMIARAVVISGGVYDESKISLGS